MTYKAVPLKDSELVNREKLRLCKPKVYEKIIRFPDQLAANKSVAIIQLQYSYVCNMWCSHCSIALLRKRSRDGAARLLDIPTVKRVFDEADAYGLAQMGISGGEPTLFKDLPELVRAIGPDRFHIQLDTNGWRMTPTMAAMVKQLGIDKVQISLDGFDAKAHDDFRRKPGSYERCIKAIAACQQFDLPVQVCTVVDHARAQTDDLERFLQMMRYMGVSTSVHYVKPTGELEGHTETLCTPEDIARTKQAMKGFKAYDHTTPGYGIDYGCLAVKRMFTITAYGDILPCPWMMWTLGNIFDTPLADILAEGMKRFGPYFPVCRLSESRPFLDLYRQSLRGKPLPVPIEQTGYEHQNPA